MTNFKYLRCVYLQKFYVDLRQQKPFEVTLHARAPLPVDLGTTQDFIKRMDIGAQANKLLSHAQVAILAS